MSRPFTCTECGATVALVERHDGHLGVACDCHSETLEERFYFTQPASVEGFLRTVTQWEPES